MVGTSQITVSVPKTVDAVQLPLMQLRLSLDLVKEATAGQPVTFSVTSPPNSPAPGTKSPPSALFTGASSATLIFPKDPANPDPSQDDTVTIIPPSTGLAANDPQRNRYELFLTLNTVYNPNGCANIMPADETWTIAVTPASLNISSAGIGSFTRPTCTGPLAPVRATGQIKVATVGGAGLGEQASRPGVDVVLVLDRSGSMGSPAIDGQPTPTRITELQQSLKEFSKVWTNLRTSEGSSSPTDNVGITIFDDQIEWWNQLPAGLNTFSAGVDTTIENNVGTITARNLTSIGGGLLQGANALTVVDPTRRRVILLMSDGLQNTDPMVGVTNNQLVTYPQNNPSQTTPLPNQPSYQIYTVTVGPSNLVNAPINQQIAHTTNGFYTNSENDATLLDQFFLELLQNFIHFTSWETFRLIQAQLTQAAPTYTATVPVSTTTTNVSVALRAIRTDIPLRLSVTPPGESKPTQAITLDGTTVLNFVIPTSASYNPLGQWTILVDVAPVIIEGPAVSATAPAPVLSFNLVMLGDDIGLRSELNIVPADYTPGQPIQLEARLIQFGKPVTGLGSRPGDKLVVEVVKPGVSVGDLLSDSTAPTTPPFADLTNPAQAKLYNQLQAHPASLNRITGDVVTLTEDGAGVYRGSYAVQTPGHYNFLFGIAGETRNVGKFSREQIKTVYVRAKPDGTVTNMQTSIQVISGGNQQTITFTPRTKFGHRPGPGLANYFWFTTPGQAPFKAVDNLDGTYTAKLLYSGLLPSVALHFIDVAMIIGDATPPDKLPVPLGPNTVLVPDINQVARDVPSIGTWLVLGPIFDPRHQLGPEPGPAPRPTAGQIIADIDHHLDQLNPAILTSDRAHGPFEGRVAAYGGTLMAARPYRWRKRYFAGMDWSDINDVRNDIHDHLVGDYGEDQFDRRDYLNFAGKHHALTFFVVYIISPDDRTTRLALRHADSLRVWLNGAELRKDIELPFVGDHNITDHPETLVPINLHRGINILLAAVAVTDREWGFSARIEAYQGLDITADLPDNPIAACRSAFEFVCVAGDGNSWHPRDLNRALFCIGNKIWRGRVRLMDEDFKFVGHIADRPDLVWFGMEGQAEEAQRGRPFENETAGIYEVIFNEENPTHPVLILVKPFSMGEH